MVVCNTNYEFTLIDFGDIGCQSDSGVYIYSNLGFYIDMNKINRPKPEPITGYTSNTFLWLMKAFL